MKFAVTSDIHYGATSGRFGEPENFSRAIEIFQRCDKVYMNGDILDISLNLIPTHRIFVPNDDETLDLIEARTKKLAPMLKIIMASCPNTEFVYIKGNHDYFPDFFRLLPELMGEHSPRLTLVDRFVRLKDTVIIHGDDVNTPAEKHVMSIRGISRAKRSVPNSKLLGEEIALHKEFLEKLPEITNLDGVKKVFTGHFHVSQHGLEIPDTGVTVYNSGSFSHGNEATIFECESGKNGVENIQPHIFEAGLSQIR